MTSGISHIRARLGGLRGLRRLTCRGPRTSAARIPPAAGVRLLRCRSVPCLAALLRAASRPPGRAVRSDGSVWPGYPASPGSAGPPSGVPGFAGVTSLTGVPGLPGQPGQAGPPRRPARSRGEAGPARVAVRPGPMRRTRRGCIPDASRSAADAGAPGRRAAGPSAGLEESPGRRPGCSRQPPGPALSSGPDRAGAAELAHSPSRASSSTAQVWVAVASADGSLTGQQRVLGLSGIGAGPGGQRRAARRRRRCGARARSRARTGPAGTPGRALRVQAGIRGPGRVRPAPRCGTPRRSTVTRETMIRRWRERSRVLPGSPGPAAGPGGARRSRVTGPRRRSRAGPGPPGKCRGRARCPRPGGGGCRCGFSPAGRFRGRRSPPAGRYRVQLACPVGCPPGRRPRHPGSPCRERIVLWDRPRADRQFAPRPGLHRSL